MKKEDTVAIRIIESDLKRNAKVSKKRTFRIPYSKEEERKMRILGVSNMDKIPTNDSKMIHNLIKGKNIVILGDIQRRCVGILVKKISEIKENRSEIYIVSSELVGGHSVEERVNSKEVNDILISYIYNGTLEYIMTGGIPAVVITDSSVGGCSYIETLLTILGEHKNYKIEMNMDANRVLEVAAHEYYYTGLNNGDLSRVKNIGISEVWLSTWRLMRESSTLERVCSRLKSECNNAVIVSVNPHGYICVLHKRGVQIENIFEEEGIDVLDVNRYEDFEK